MQKSVSQKIKTNISQMKTLVEHGKKIPFSDNVKIDRIEFLQKINEVERAITSIEKLEREIIERAQEDAQIILEDAENQRSAILASLINDPKIIPYTAELASEEFANLIINIATSLQNEILRSQKQINQSIGVTLTRLNNTKIELQNSSQGPMTERRKNTSHKKEAIS